MRKGKMTIQEATREWFEREGYEFEPHNQVEDGGLHECGDGCLVFRKNKDSRWHHFKELPTIDANYFFDKVVGRMNELGLSPGIGQINGVWSVEWTQANSPYDHISEANDNDIVLAGLQAAIAAVERPRNTWRGSDGNL